MRNEETKQVIEDSSDRAVIYMTNKEEVSEETLVVERIIKSNSGLLISY
jgi:hypothetical protein